jgi:hypothetical protein
MVLTVEQYELLYSMVNASIKHAMDSGIPIGKEYYEDIDIIKDELRNEIREMRMKEMLQHDSNC